MTGECCSKRGLLLGLAVAVWAWAFDFLIHGKLLMSMYEATASMWRPMSEMQEMGLWCIAYHLGMGILFASGYLCWRKHIVVGAVGSSECPYRKSMGFGLWVGLLLGLPQLMTYMWLPFTSFDLPIAWAVSELVKWTLAGLLLAKLYR